jgi:predicted GTPase
VGADQALAEWLRRSYDSERVLLVANKAEGAAARAGVRGGGGGGWGQ